MQKKCLNKRTFRGKGGLLMDCPCVAIMGNLTEGFKVVGPFDSFDSAASFADGQESWITTLISPQEWQGTIE
jgi:hypothetical protein